MDPNIMIGIVVVVGLVVGTILCALMEKDSAPRSDQQRSRDAIDRVAQSNWID